MLLPASINFKLIKGRDNTKSFELLDSDGVYDITDKDFNFLFYYLGHTEAPKNIHIDKYDSEGVIDVVFSDTDLDSLGIFEYVLEEVNPSGVNYPLIKGNIEVLPFVPFSDTVQAYLDSELPKNIQLTPEYIDQRVRYWRLFLQDGFNIIDSNVHIAEAWPILANALFAKLVVYDAMVLAMKGNLLGFFGGDYTQGSDWGGSIKSIETGPSSVEFHPLGKSFSDILGKNASGVSPLDSLLVSLCGLGNKLGIKLPMCTFRKTVHSPIYSVNQDWVYPKLTDILPKSRG